MREPIQILMEKVRCPGWPACVEEIYEKAMARYDAEGCFLTDPAYYASVAERYGIFQTELDTFQRAAVAVGQNEAYSRYLLLIYVFLTEVPFTKAELKAFRILPTADASDFALDMLPGLALYGQFPRCYENLKNRGLPEAMIRDLMARPERTVAGFRKLHNGAEGFHLFKWYQRLIRVDIYDIGCLQVELHIPFTNQACLFRSLDGQHVALARECKLHPTGRMLGCRGYEESPDAWEPNITETDAYWEGYAYGSDGLVQQELIRLEKDHWEIAVAPEAPCISLHIPSKVRLDNESVTQSLAQIKAFLKTYFPDYPYKAIFCSSWILNPALAEMLPRESNLSRFCRRFLPMTQAAAGNDVFNFVFRLSAPPKDLETLDESTSLQRSLKKYYMDGNILHEMCGCMINDGAIE
jgi:hypothetical protein